MDELLVVIKGLSQNISLFLSLAFIYYLLTSTVKISSKVLRDFLIGFVFSMIAGLGMVLRIQVAPGLYIDGRLLLVGISGAFNGPVSGITTTFFVLIFRVLLGGNGVLVGSFGIIGAGLIGLIFWKKIKTSQEYYTLKSLIVLGLLLTLQGQAWIFLFFKPDIALSLIKKVFLPGVIVYPVGSVFIGALLNYVQKNIKTELQLKESESNLRHLNAELESRVKKRTNQLEATNEQLQNEKEKLQKALDDVKKLSGLLPICSHCKKIRDDNGYWNQLEDYIDKHSEAVFSHGICEDCLEKYYPEDPVSKRRFSSHGR